MKRLPPAPLSWTSLGLPEEGYRCLTDPSFWGIPLRQALARSAWLHSLPKSQQAQFTARTLSLVSLRIRPHLDQIEVLLPASIVAALLLAHQAPLDPDQVPPTGTLGSKVPWTNPQDGPPDQDGENVENVEKEDEEMAAWFDQDYSARLLKYYQEFTEPAEEQTFDELRGWLEAMRNDVLYVCRTAILDGTGIPSVWEQFAHHDTQVFSFNALAYPVIEMHEDDPEIDDPATMHSLLAHRITDHLTADDTVMQSIRPRDCPAIARTVANKAPTGDLDTFLTTGIWAPSAMQPSEMFLQYLDAGMPRSMIQPLREANIKNKARGNGTYSRNRAQRAENNEWQHNPELWAAGTWQAGWQSGTAWTPGQASSSGQQSNQRAPSRGSGTWHPRNWG